VVLVDQLLARVKRLEHELSLRPLPVRTVSGKRGLFFPVTSGIGGDHIPGLHPDNSGHQYRMVPARDLNVD
jgi:hypothetical protein